MAKTKSFGGLIVLLVVLAAAGAGAWIYFKKGAEKQPEFQSTKVTRGDIVQTVTATGDLQPVVTVDVGAQVSGQIKEVLVDFNSRVKAGDVLARIDDSTPLQRLRQAEADLASAEANNFLILTNAKRQRELFEKNLVSQQEIDAIEAQLAQSNATLLTRRAAVEDAKLNVQRCTIVAPIDGIVLVRQTDKGRTVNSSTNAPVLFTLVNDLSKMQINAAVAEADVGMVSEGQEVTFTVDAFPNRDFRGTVRQVRNAATANQSVVSYATIIDVGNEDLKLKPGMTANVSVIVERKSNVLRVANSALRVRVPAELQPKAPATPANTTEKAAEKTAVPAAMSDEERFAAMRAVMTEAGIQRGTPPTPEQTEKAKKLAAAKGLDAEMVTRMLNRTGGRGQGGGQGGGANGGFGGARRGGTVSTVVTRTLYRIPNPTAGTPKLEAVSVRLGISDGFTTEVVEGLAENDTVLTGVIMPNANPVPQSGGMQNPFQQRGGGFGGGGGGPGGGGGRR